MANTIALKHRIGSVKNTRQITKAMELVSASKMRRAQERAKLSRDYQVAAYDLLARLSTLKEVEIHPLFAKRKVKSRLYVVITSNSGLAGAYNYNVLKALTSSVRSDRDNGIASYVITVGSKGAQFARRLEHIQLTAVYPALGDTPSSADLWPILNTMIEEYKEKKIDQASLIYTVFVSNLKQQATVLDILPAKVAEETDKPTYKYSFTNFEPSVDVVLDSVAVRLLEIQVWQALLESLASEHSMRMAAMKNATDNANDLIDDLTLEFNTARQSAITQELAEITGGAEAIAK
jgi:F-type H+-transporting ATPase subunit gamma